jgi:hypothetical protein
MRIGVAGLPLLAVRAERWRQTLPFAAALARARSLGRSRPARPEAERSRWWRWITRVDRLFPGGANCYRRVLIAAASDRGFAETRFTIGLDLDGDAARGHVWIGEARGRERPYAVELRV